jgi:hypothetical protein
MGLKEIPRKERTFDVCLKELKKGQSELKYVPHLLKTEKLLNRIIITAAIKWVPHELKTYELCLDAVKKGKYALLYVPRKYKTEDMCITALRYNFSTAINYLPKRYKNINFYKNAINQVGQIIQFFPDSEKTKFYCSVAFESDPKAIKYIPEIFKNDINFLRHVEENRLKVSEMIKRNLHYKTIVYEYVPNPKKDILCASSLIFDEGHLTIGGKEYFANGYDCGNELCYKLDDPQFFLSVLSKRYTKKYINLLNRNEKYYYKNLKDNNSKEIFLYLISIGIINLVEFKKYMEENNIKVKRFQIWVPNGSVNYFVI